MNEYDPICLPENKEAEDYNKLIESMKKELWEISKIDVGHFKNKQNMDKVNVKIINRSVHNLPKYATPGSSGMDLKANILEPIKIGAGERYKIPTGIFIQLPEGYECQIRSRSGLADKYGITVLNSPATIDSDYTGELFVIIYNSSKFDYVVNPGDRIAQMVIARYSNVTWEEVSTLEKTERGAGGLGHTGL